MNKEDFFIQQFKDSTHIGDDGAVIGKWVYSMDAFYEDVHFKRDWMSLKQIAKKAMLVNISDAIVMNAVPKYALLSVAIPKELTTKQLKKLAQGFKFVAKQYNMQIIGGDTIANDKLHISVTIVSQTKKPMMRTGTQIDDMICYTGKLGSVQRDLDSLLDGKKLDRKSKFITPQLQAEFFYAVAPYINSALDISDGLFFELERLSKANKIGFDFVKPIKTNIGCSGEEYEILFTFNPKYQNKIQKIAGKYKVKLNIFAKAKKGKYQCRCTKHHF
ncbi:MAG: thiamine-phosphate kinase [Campylobacterota bacterium]|nr:thiamine-phosphate kinase [Campylobacterota bacterium]